MLWRLRRLLRRPTWPARPSARLVRKQEAPRLLRHLLRSEVLRGQVPGSEVLRGQVLPGSEVLPRSEVLRGQVLPGREVLLRSAVLRGRVLPRCQVRDLLRRRLRSSELLRSPARVVREQEASRLLRHLLPRSQVLR